MWGTTFTAISIFVSALHIGRIASVVQAAIKETRSDLQFIDGGWLAASMSSWAWPLAATIFPLKFIISLCKSRICLDERIDSARCSQGHRIRAATAAASLPNYQFSGDIPASDRDW